MPYELVYKCVDCGRVHDRKPDACEDCGGQEFDPVEEW